MFDGLIDTYGFTELILNNDNFNRNIVPTMKGMLNVLRHFNLVKIIFLLMLTKSVPLQLKNDFVA